LPTGFVIARHELEFRKPIFGNDERVFCFYFLGW
jgi:hypothetical protein